MGAINIENVDEQVLKSIRLRARSHGRSFEDEVKAVLAEAAELKMTPEERVAEFRAVQAVTPGEEEQVDGAEIIRKLRDRASRKPLPRMSPEEFAAEAARIRAMTPKGVVQTDSTEIIRELRDRGYAGR